MIILDLYERRFASKFPVRNYQNFYHYRGFSRLSSNILKDFQDRSDEEILIHELDDEIEKPF